MPVVPAPRQVGGLRAMPPALPTPTPEAVTWTGWRATSTGWRRSVEGRGVAHAARRARPRRRPRRVRRSPGGPAGLQAAGPLAGGLPTPLACGPMPERVPVPVVCRSKPGAPVPEEEEVGPRSGPQVPVPAAAVAALGEVAAVVAEEVVPPWRPGHRRRGDRRRSPRSRPQTAVAGCRCTPRRSGSQGSSTVATSGHTGFTCWEDLSARNPRSEDRAMASTTVPKRLPVSIPEPLS